MKFRIWNPELHTFVGGDEWYIHPDGRVMFYDVLEGKLIESYCIATKVCDGLQDTNGDDIYYGDWIKSTSYLDGKSFIRRFRIEYIEDEIQIRNRIGVGNIVEVDGNIFE